MISRAGGNPGNSIFMILVILAIFQILPDLGPNSLQTLSASDKCS